MNNYDDSNSQQNRDIKYIKHDVQYEDGLAEKEGAQADEDDEHKYLEGFEDEGEEDGSRLSIVEKD